MKQHFLHRHELPYVTVSLGNNAFMNAVVGKPETEVVQRDRQVDYSEGGFAHTIRPQNGSSFNNITVELLRAQGTAKNRCEKIVDGPLGDGKSGPDSPLKALLKLFNLKPAFTTDDIFKRFFSSFWCGQEWCCWPRCTGVWWGAIPRTLVPPTVFLSWILKGETP